MSEHMGPIAASHATQAHKSPQNTHKARLQNRQAQFLGPLNNTNASVSLLSRAHFTL